MIVWDLAPFAAAGKLERFLYQLPQPGVWSTQIVGFGLTDVDDPPIGFTVFLNLIARDFAGFGGLSSCLQTLRDWCLPPSTGHDLEASLGLRSSFAKEPSGWFEGMEHDFRNTVTLWKAPLTEAGLWDIQRRIDFWQNSR